MTSRSPEGPTNVLIVGVGGQGVIMISKVLARLCQMNGLEVKQSEVHGMAKRGGAVFSHVRFGAEVWSPTIPVGEADILVALEWAEGLRWLHYLDPDGGTFISDTKRIVPPFACRNRRYGAAPTYVRTTVADLLQQVPNSFAVDATEIAGGLGNARVANTVLLGTLSTALDFVPADWQTVIGEFVPPGSEDANRRAFDLGRDWVTGQREPAPTVGHEPELADAGSVEIRLEITQAWCKGCDICVKMCPERCLALNEHQVAVLSDPEACTGCRICEWLCPDFAITVHKQFAAAVAV